MSSSNQLRKTCHRKRHGRRSITAGSLNSHALSPRSTDLESDPGFSSPSEGQDSEGESPRRPAARTSTIWSIKSPSQKSDFSAVVPWMLPEGSKDSEVRSQVRRGSTQHFYSPMSQKKLAVLWANKSRIARFKDSHSYELFNGFLILLNAAFVVWETERRAVYAETHPEADSTTDDPFFRVAANIFSAFFLADLTLRVYAEGLAFFQTREWAWNVFDIGCVLTAVAEVAVRWCEWVLENEMRSYRMFLRKFVMFRILRLLRVVRCVKQTRLIEFIRELRLMVFSLTGALKSWAWSVVLMLFIFCIFGVFFTDGAVGHCATSGAMQIESTEALRMHFGTLSRAVLSLYMALTGGEDWAIVYTALQPLSFEYQLSFLAFITFGILALLNVVTAVFVGHAMHCAQSDQELTVMEEMKNKAGLVCLIEQVFLEFDNDLSGGLTLEEFKKIVEDDKIRAYLATLGMDLTQITTVFCLLDTDHSGRVDKHEFIEGIIRLKGPASSIDMAVVRAQLKWVIGAMSEMLESEIEDVKAPELH